MAVTNKLRYSWENPENELLGTDGTDGNRIEGVVYSPRYTHIRGRCWEGQIQLWQAFSDDPKSAIINMENIDIENIRVEDDVVVTIEDDNRLRVCLP